MKKPKTNMRSKLIELMGWYGAAAILIAYALVSTSVILPQSWQYQLLNLTGSLGILVVSVARRAKQPAVLNVVWSAVALVALIGIAFK